MKHARTLDHQNCSYIDVFGCNAQDDAVKANTPISQHEDHDHEIIRNVLKGNGEQFTRLYDSYHRQIFGYVLGMVGYHIQTCEDICSEIWIKAYKKLPQYNFKKRFFSWIYAIARNTTIDALRKIKRKPEPISLDESSIPHQLHIDDIDYSKEHAFLILSKLRPKDKEILVMRYIQELQPREISQLLNISTTSVSAKITRAKQRARILISHYE